ARSLPREVARQTGGTGRAGIVAETTPGGAGAGAQRIATRPPLEGGRGPGRGGRRGGAGAEVRAGGPPRRRARRPAGSSGAPRAGDGPRICRTASAVLLTPWMNASESWPPFVFETSRPSGHARPPRSTNAPPSPAGAKP